MSQTTSHLSETAAGSVVKRNRSRFRRLMRQVRRLSNFGLRIGLWLLIAFGAFAIMQAYLDDGYTLGAFDVPQVLGQAGYTGEVVPRRIYDAMIDLQDQSTSARDFEEFSQSQRQASVDVQVAGFGVSFESVAQRLKRVTGKTQRVFSGELTLSNDSIILNLRQNGLSVGAYKCVYLSSGDLEAELSVLFEKAAEGVFEITEPYLFAVMINDRDSISAKRAFRIAKELAYGEDVEEQHWGLNFIGNSLNAEGDSVRARSYFLDAINAEKTFPIPYSNLYLSYLQNEILDSLEYISDLASRNLSEKDYNSIFSYWEIDYALMKGDDAGVASAIQELSSKEGVEEYKYQRLSNSLFNAAKMSLGEEVLELAMKAYPHNDAWIDSYIMVNLFQEDFEIVQSHLDDLKRKQTPQGRLDLVETWLAFGLTPNTETSESLKKIIDVGNALPSSSMIPKLAEIYIPYRMGDSTRLFELAEALDEKINILNVGGVPDVDWLEQVFERYSELKEIEEEKVN